MAGRKGGIKDDTLRRKRDNLIYGIRKSYRGRVEA